MEVLFLHFYPFEPLAQFEYENKCNQLLSYQTVGESHKQRHDVH